MTDENAVLVADDESDVEDSTFDHFSAEDTGSSPVSGSDGDYDSDEDEETQSDESYDPYATLVDKNESAEKQSHKSSVQSEAQALANKWDTMSEVKQEERLANLKANRPVVYKALLAELSSSDTGVNDKANASSNIPDEYQPLLEEANRQRFVAEVHKFCAHNKIDSDKADALTRYGSELHNKFSSLKFDPETGKKLDFGKRLELSLRGTDEIQSLIVTQRANKKAAGIAKGVQMKGLNGDTSASAKKLYELDYADFLKESNRMAGGQQWD